MEAKASVTYISKGFEWLAETASPFFKGIDFYNGESRIAVSLKTVNADKNFDFKNILKNIDELGKLKKVGKSVYNGNERVIEKVELHLATPQGYDKNLLKDVEKAAKDNGVEVRYIKIE